jgi:hypothetical protein
MAYFKILFPGIIQDSLQFFTGSRKQPVLSFFAVFFRRIYDSRFGKTGVGNFHNISLTLSKFGIITTSNKTGCVSCSSRQADEVFGTQHRGCFFGIGVATPATEDTTRVFIPAVN